jgi:hypothetical protein
MKCEFCKREVVYYGDAILHLEVCKEYKKVTKMKTKKEVLEANGWTVFEGYCFPSPRADEDDQYTFVEKEEALKVFSEGVKIYFWDECKERLLDEEEAWEFFYEDWCDTNLDETKQDLDFTEWEIEMLK